MTRRRGPVRIPLHLERDELLAALTWATVVGAFVGAAMVMLLMMLVALVQGAGTWPLALAAVAVLAFGAAFVFRTGGGIVKPRDAPILAGDSPIMPLAPATEWDGISAEYLDGHGATRLDPSTLDDR